MTSVKEQNGGGNSIFFDNLQPGTTEKDILDYFSKFGEIQDAGMVKTNEAPLLPPNSGFLCFKNPQVAEHVLTQQHTIQGEKVDINSPDRYRKIWIGSVPAHIKDKTIENYFSRFGELEYARLNSGNNSRGTIISNHTYGHVKFSSVESTIKTLFQKNHVIEDAEIDVQLAMPRQRKTHNHFDVDKIIFVKNLPSKGITIDALANYFQDFGSLKRINLLFDSSNVICGALVIFFNKSGAEKAFDTEYHEIDGQIVEVVQEYDDYEFCASSSTVFIENLAQEITKRALAKAFGRYGHMLSIRIMHQSGIIKFKDASLLGEMPGITEIAVGKYMVKARRCGINFFQYNKFKQPSI